MTNLSFRKSFLSVLIFVTAALGTTTASPSAYGQQSPNLINFISSADDPANQHQTSNRVQQLLIIPSLSDDDIAVVEEQAKNNEEGQLGQGLVSKQTMIDLIQQSKENEEDKIISDLSGQSGSIRQNEEEKIEENLEEVKKYQEKDEIGNEQKDNFNNNNGIPLELPFP